jgi:hypothetical protein
LYSVDRHRGEDIVVSGVRYQAGIRQVSGVKGGLSMAVRVSRTWSSA